MVHHSRKSHFRLLVAAAVAVGCGSATLSGALSAQARPLVSPAAAAEPGADGRAEVRTIGMMMADNPIG